MPQPTTIPKPGTKPDTKPGTKPNTKPDTNPWSVLAPKVNPSPKA